MKRTAIVHIGLEKTGSTAIQRWLAANQPLLKESGVLMPQQIGYPNHTQLVSACLDDGVFDNIKSYHLFAAGCSEARFRRQVFAGLDDDVRAAGSGWHTLLISSELISSRLSSASEVARLVDQIRVYVDHIRFVVFLRRQDQLALSRFSSILRSGHDQFEDVFVDYSPFNFRRLPDQRRISDDLFFYDFESILGRFEGIAHSSVDAYFYGSCDPVEMISNCIGVTGSAKQQRHARHNSALSAEAQYILAELNRIRPVQFASGMRNDAYRALQRRVEAEVKGEPRTVPRRMAADFLGRYSAINQRVFRRYGAAADSFSGDFNAYPEVVDYSLLPSCAAERLAVYQTLAEGMPQSEPIGLLLKYRAKRVKAALKMFAKTIRR